MVRRLSRRRGRRGWAGGVSHAAPAARFHRRDLQDPHDRERPAAHGPGRAALDRRRPPRHGHACLEGAALGAPAARRARLPQDLLGLLPGHEPAHRAPHVLERAGWRDERRGAAGGATVLRLDRVLEVPRAPRLLGGLPRSPDDSAWARVERYWFPLVGQVIRKPRWFAPAVAGVWVQAVHTRDSLALRLEWDDRSQSPDTAWLEFERRVLDHLVSDDSVAARAELQPDEIAVEFPRSIPAGMERPYFLMGTATDPVYQWRWTSAPRQAAAGLARGVGRFDALGAGGAPGAEARFADGQWGLGFTRAPAAAGTGKRTSV